MAILPRVTTYVIIPTRDLPSLDDKIQKKFGDTSYRLPLGEWLVAYQGTSQQLFDELDILGDKDSGSAIVLAISSYWGRTNPQVWEWFKQYSE